MSNNIENEPNYYVDPGIGTKTESCPYTHYQDGRDVYSYVIPPKGYELTGFKLEPYESDDFYNGKIVAQYEKTGFLDGQNQNLLRYLAAFVIIALIILLVVTIFNHSEPQLTQLPQSNLPETVITATPIDVDTTEEIGTVALLPDTTLYESGDSTVEMANEEIVQEEPVKEEIKEVPATPELEIAKEEPIKEEIVKENPKNEVSDASAAADQLTPEEIKAEFKKEFWNLIYHQEKRMSQYGQLYREYKGKVKGSEFNYLWLTILESTSDFKVWNQKLNQIPADEIKNVHTISQLTSKIEEYN